MSSYSRWMVVGQMTDFLRQILSSMLFLLVTDGDDEASAFYRYMNIQQQQQQHQHQHEHEHEQHSMKEGST